MERKFYLRGLGLGIAVTAAIMGIITSRGGEMSDREIIARAKELGMVENTVLSEANDESPESADKPDAGNEDAAEEESEVPVGEADGAENVVEAGDKASEGAGSEAGESIEANGTEEETNKEENAGADRAEQGTIPDASEENGQKSEITGEDGMGSVSTQEPEEDARDLITSAVVKTITINSGDGSHTVAQKLADAGVVISAETFDAFLCQNGYDKKLRTGTFSIPADASDEQIARIVTGAE